MKNSWLINTLVVLFLSGCFSCSKYPYSSVKELGPYKGAMAASYLQPDSVCFFKTSIRTYGKDLSGILALKKVSEDTLKVTFFTEMGIKFFDAVVMHDSFTVLDCIPQLKTKGVMNTLIEDIKWLVFWNVSQLSDPIALNVNSGTLLRCHYKEDWIFVTLNDSNKVSQLDYTYGKNYKSKFKIIYKDYQDNKPLSVFVKHFNFDLKIDLHYYEFK